MYNRSRGFMKDMDKTVLLKMRDDEGMTISEIAAAVGCSKATIGKILGPMDPEMRRQRKAAGARKGAETRWQKTSEGGYNMERKMQSFMPKHEEETTKAVLVMKPVKMPIPLHGEYMDYVISAERDLIDVDTSEGRTLMQIEADKLDTFIAELTAIKKNIGESKPMQFWG